MKDRLAGSLTRPLRPIMKPAKHLLQYAWVSQMALKFMTTIIFKINDKNEIYR